MARAFNDDLLPALQQGALVPIVDSVYGMQDAEAAYRYMSSNKHFGKIVLRA